MEFNSITDIYSANDAARRKLLEVLNAVSDDTAATRPANENWTIAQIAEHIAAVNEGTFRICSKLLGKSQQSEPVSDLRPLVSSDFQSRAVEIHAMKVEAPERVQPTGRVSIADSIAKLEENRKKFEELKRQFEENGDNGETFPHPFFGDITAVEWLVMAGGHESRHTRQIVRALEELR